MKLDEIFIPSHGMEAMSAMMDSYLETAVWADAEEGTDTDGLSFDKESIANARSDVQEFYTKAAKVLDGFDHDEAFWQNVGHDLWLTRNGHGAGFWDKPELYGGQESGDALSSIATAMGEKNLYVGDDGKLHIT